MKERTNWLIPITFNHKPHESGYLLDVRGFNGVALCLTTTHQNELFRAYYKIKFSHDTVDSMSATYKKYQGDKGLLCTASPFILDRTEDFPTHLKISGPGAPQGDLIVRAYDLEGGPFIPDSSTCPEGPPSVPLKPVRNINPAPKDGCHIVDGAMPQHQEGQRSCVIQECQIEGYFDLTEHDHVQIADSTLEFSSWEDLDRILGKQTNVFRNCKFKWAATEPADGEEELKEPPADKLVVDTGPLHSRITALSHRVTEQKCQINTLTEQLRLANLAKKYLYTAWCITLVAFVILLLAR